MYNLLYTSPVPSPDTIKIMDGDGRGSCYEKGPFESFEDAQYAKDEAIAQKLLEWSHGDDPDGNSPFWRFPPSGGETEPPQWAHNYGFRFYARNQYARYWSVKV